MPLNLHAYNIDELIELGHSYADKYCVHVEVLSSLSHWEHINDQLIESKGELTYSQEYYIKVGYLWEVSICPLYTYGFFWLIQNLGWSVVYTEGSHAIIFIYM